MDESPDLNIYRSAAMAFNPQASSSSAAPGQMVLRQTLTMQQDVLRSSGASGETHSNPTGAAPNGADGDVSAMPALPAPSHYGPVVPSRQSAAMTRVHPHQLMREESDRQLMSQQG